MKRLYAIAIVLLLVGALAFAGGQKEPGKTKIVLVHGYADFYQAIMDQYVADNPQVDLVWVPKGGGVVAVDALIAAKEKPNVFMSTPGELGKFLQPGFALGLTGANIPDLADFKPPTLQPYYRDGQLLALPVTVAVNAFDVNLSLAGDAGFAVPDADYMSIDQFTAFSQAIKALGRDGVYGTEIWAGNMGSQSINWHWLSAFGAQFYENGDYSHTTLNSPEAVRGLNYMRYLVQQGYAPPEAPVLDDDEAIAFWAAGKIGALWARAGGWLSMIDNAVKQGMLDQRFEHRFMTWPVADGVDGNPLSFGGAAGMVIASGNAQTDALAVKLLDVMTGKEAQEKTIGPGAGYGTRFSVVEPSLATGPGASYDPDWKHYQKIGELFAKYGALDVGVSTVYVTAMTQEWLKIFQPFIKGEISAEKALADFETAFDKVLAE